MRDQILQAIDSPEQLEALYREAPGEFARVFPEVFSERPDSVILAVWHERLFYGPESAETVDEPSATWSRRDILLTIVLAVAVGTIVKLPLFIPAINHDRFYSRNLGGIIATSLIAYFCTRKGSRAKVIWTILGLTLGAFLYLNLLPDKSGSQTLVLACMHMPFFLWSLLGVAFLGGTWRSLQGRMDYIRYNGELLIHTTILLIGGMVLTGITFALFSLIGQNVEDWYMNNVVVYGAVACPLVATLFVDKIFGKRLKIASLLAKIFTPLFLLTVVAYLIAMIVTRKSPYSDRDFLIVFNGLLLIVLGLSVLSISERDSQKERVFGDFMNIGLVTVTLIIDVVALSAIVFRVTSYGFTPNRLAVLGANLLIFCHLTGIVYHYARLVFRKSAFTPLETWIASYLPAYTLWSVIVAFAFPLAFGFK